MIRPVKNNVTLRNRRNNDSGLIYFRHEIAMPDGTVFARTDWREYQWAVVTRRNDAWRVLALTANKARMRGLILRLTARSIDALALPVTSKAVGTAAELDIKLTARLAAERVAQRRERIKDWISSHRRAIEKLRARVVALEHEFIRLGQSPVRVAKRKRGKR